MNILITGGAGYLGSILTRKLLGLGYNITVLDNFLYGYSSLAGVRANIRIRDIRDIEEIDLEKHDIIIHLASIVGDSACDLDSNQTIEVNYEATKNIAEICNKLNKKLIYSSTCSIYGENPGKICKEEDKTILPISLYGKTKLKSEEVIKQSGCDYIIFRLGTLFGLSYRMRFDLAINLFVGKAIKKEFFTVFGGDQIRPFLHVTDAAELIIFGLKNNWNGIFNAAWKNISIEEVAKEISLVFNTPFTISKKIVDKRNYKVDCKKITKLGFNPLVNCKQIQYACGEINTAYNLGYWNDYKKSIYSNHKYLFENKELMKDIYTKGPIYRGREK